jgi:hypothetical protein
MAAAAVFWSEREKRPWERASLACLPDGRTRRGPALLEKPRMARVFTLWLRQSSF